MKAYTQLCSHIPQMGFYTHVSTMKAIRQRWKNHSGSRLRSISTCRRHACSSNADRNARVVVLCSGTRYVLITSPLRDTHIHLHPKSKLVCRFIAVTAAQTCGTEVGPEKRDTIARCRAASRSASVLQCASS